MRDEISEMELIELADKETLTTLQHYGLCLNNDFVPEEYLGLLGHQLVDIWLSGWRASEERRK